MPEQVVNPQKVVEYFRDRDPLDTSYLTDRQVYEHAQREFPDYDYPVWIEDQKEVKKEKPNLSRVDTAPSALGMLGSFFSSSLVDPENPLTGGLIDDDSKYFQDTLINQVQVFYGKQCMENRNIT